MIVERKTISLLLFAAVLATVESQQGKYVENVCLSQPTMEFEITVMVRKPGDMKICDSQHFIDFLEGKILKASTEAVNKECRFRELTHFYCRESTRRRITIGLKTNLTCGSSCIRHRNTRTSIREIGHQKDSIHTTMKMITKRLKVNYNNADVTVFIFPGRKKSVVNVCSNSRTMDNTTRRKLMLCRCPEDCPTNMTKVCPKNMVYRECGSACPPSCDNQSPICNTQCIKGCFCPNGMAEHDGNCLDFENCPEPVAVEEKINGFDSMNRLKRHSSSNQMNTGQKHDADGSGEDEVDHSGKKKRKKNQGQDNEVEHSGSGEGEVDPSGKKKRKKNQGQDNEVEHSGSGEVDPSGKKKRKKNHGQDNGVEHTGSGEGEVDPSGKKKRKKNQGQDNGVEHTGSGEGEVDPSGKKKRKKNQGQDNEVEHTGSGEGKVDPTGNTIGNTTDSSKR